MIVRCLQLHKFSTFSVTFQETQYYLECCGLVLINPHVVEQENVLWLSHLDSSTNMGPIIHSVIIIIFRLHFICTHITFSNYLH